MTSWLLHVGRLLSRCATEPLRLIMGDDHLGTHWSHSALTWLHPLYLALLNCYTVIYPLMYAYRSRRVQRDIKRIIGIKPRLTKQERTFKKLKSFSCPQLVLTSCLTLPGLGLSLANMKSCRSFMYMKARQFHLALSITSYSEGQ